MSRRSSARTAILEAARRLAARGGTADLSLTAVAAEAGFGPSTVFGHFHNRDELLIAVIAEDMGGLASQMRGVLSAGRQSGLSEPQIDEAARSSSSDVADPEVESHSDSPLENVSAPQPLPARFSEKRRLSLLKHVPTQDPQTPDADSDAGSEPTKLRVDAWLERRLRVFEHALGDIQHRLEDNERGTVRAMGIAEDATKILAARLETLEMRHAEELQHLSERVDEGERRRLDMAAEFRAAANDAAERLDVLEAARRAQLQREVENMTSDVPAPELQSTSASLESAPVEPMESSDEFGEAEAEVPPEIAEANSYLAAARRAASAAAELRASNIDGEVSDPAWKSFARARVHVERKHYVAALCAAAVAFTAGGFAAFSIGAVHGRAQVHPPQAGSFIAASRAHALLSRARMKMPLDRLADLANAGDPKAELMIGLKYLHGDGVAPDQPRAAQWIARAARQKEPLAQYWMGALYEHGDGVAADAAEAVHWYEAAAAQGNRKAMHALGLAYAEGRGTQKDLSEAARWFDRAAQLGFVNSEFNLAVLYERGEGVPQSLTDAYKWYAIAAAQGDQESRTRTEALRTQLSTAEIATAERAAVKFHPQGMDQRANAGPVLAEMGRTASVAR